VSGADTYALLSDSRRHERGSSASYARVRFVPEEGSELFEIAGRPISEVSLLDGHLCGEPPGEFCLICESNVDVQEAIFEFVLNPLDHLPLHTTVLMASHEFER
jgi:hypothetical protein